MWTGGKDSKILERGYKTAISLRTALTRALCAVVIVYAVAGLAYWYSQQPKRVKRLHTDVIQDKYEHLVKRIEGSSPAYWLSRKRAEKDLDELEWLLENRHSYLKTKEVDYKAALDSVRSGLGNGIERGVLALQLRKFMTMFGDGHSGAGPSMKHMYRGHGYLPFLVGQVGDRVVAFKRDRSGFLGDGYPFLQSIDGIDVEEWLEIARRTVPQRFSTTH